MRQIHADLLNVGDFDAGDIDAGDIAYDSFPCTKIQNLNNNQAQQEDEMCAFVSVEICFTSC